ncbi:MAG: DNA polymerase III subunit gamma/tau, partial [Nitrospinaceae bacterium]
FETDELQQMFTVLSRTEMEMKRSSLASMIFEMAVLRLSDVRPFRNIDEMIQRINRIEEESPQVQPAPGREKSGSAAANPALEGTDNREGDPEPESGELFPESPKWEQVKKDICKKRPVFNHYLAGCQALGFDNATLHLSFGDAYLKELVEEDKNVSSIKEAVKALYSCDVKVKFSLRELPARPIPPPVNKKEKKTLSDYNKGQQKSESEIIQDALDIFGGVVIR